MNNAILYSEWLKNNEFDDDSFKNEFKNLLENIEQPTICFLTTNDYNYVNEQIANHLKSTKGQITNLYHFTFLAKPYYLPTQNNETTSYDDAKALFNSVYYGEDNSLFIIEDNGKVFSNKRYKNQLETIFELLNNFLENSAKKILIFIETPNFVAYLLKEYKKTFQPLIEDNKLKLLNARIVETPDENGFFYQGQLKCFLPYLHAYWVEGNNNNRNQQQISLDKLQGKELGDNGNRRFLRADQALDWIKSLIQNPSDSLTPKEDLAKNIYLALKAWLVPIEYYLFERPHLLERRVEAICLLPKFPWPWSRKPDMFPDSIREYFEGLDVVHTPESERAGLTRYLCNGWDIDNQGNLIKSDTSSIWGPSTSIVPHKLNDAPRRLMISASLQTRAVNLLPSSVEQEADIDIPNDIINTKHEWDPPGKNCLAVLSTFGGYTHEDAIVISESAAKKLSKSEEKHIHVLIPSVISKIDINVKEDNDIKVGDVLLKTFIDLYALGYNYPEATRLIQQYNPELNANNTEDEGKSTKKTKVKKVTNPLQGWLEVALPTAIAPVAGKILEIKQYTIMDFFNGKNKDIPDTYFRLLKQQYKNVKPLEYRGIITFVLEVIKAVEVGDKLSTRHGIKGVVSQILNDAEMLKVNNQPSEIIFSPIGIARRGAIGQFYELLNNPNNNTVLNLDNLPHDGNIFVMRQSQDALERCRVEDTSKNIHGQRYGEMEFYGLMAHGAINIAKELLSFKRSTSGWMKDEALSKLQTLLDFSNTDIPRKSTGISKIKTEIDKKIKKTKEIKEKLLLKRSIPWQEWEKLLGDYKKFITHQQLATQALNRYLAIIGVKIEKRQLIKALPNKTFDIPCSTFTQCKKAWDETLKDSDKFISEGLGVLNLKETVDVVITFGEGNEQGKNTKHYSYTLDKVYVLPPWLRPDGTTFTNKITLAYRKLMYCLAFPYQKTKEEISTSVKNIIKLVLGDTFGVQAFLRREILGRRLTRSARAVIVPKPDLAIDQVSLPKSMWNQLFADFPDKSKELVLVNRNPTLHKYGLLALRPVKNSSEDQVIGLPLAILNGLGADFDGDQVSVVAIESPEALEEARNLLPGSNNLKLDPFRQNTPAFRLIKEFESKEKEFQQALCSDNQKDWVKKHQEILKEIIKTTEDGWKSSCMKEALEEKAKKSGLLEGLSEEEWLKFAITDEMPKVTKAPRRKGRFGGILRQQLYHRVYINDESFWQTVSALQSVTERLVQKTLSVKAGDGPLEFPVETFFTKPSKTFEKDLKNLDEEFPLDIDKLLGSIGTYTKNLEGLLAWLAKPTLENFLEIVKQLPQQALNNEISDPRIAWFID